MSWNEPGGDNKDPWSGRGGGDQKGPPDLDEAIRTLQEKLSNLFGGKKSGDGGSSGSLLPGNSKQNLIYVAVGIFALWLLSGLYTIDEGKQGVETQFGKYTRTTDSGLNWHLPVPIENVEKVDVQQQRYIEIGKRISANARQPGVSTSAKGDEELMLTRDENYVDVQLAVQYQVKDPKAFLFSLKDPRATLIQVTESVLRGVIGGSEMDFVLTEGRSEVVAQAKKEIQEVMDGYNSGVQVTTVNLQDAQAPEQVQHAYEDAIKAREDEQRFINEAKAYANDIVPRARGAAARRLQEAEGYKEQVVAQAEGETNRFTKLLTEYKKAPAVTRQRLYLEAMETVLSETSPVMIDVKGGNNIMYLPLDKIVQQKQSAVQVEEPLSSEPVVEQRKPTSRVRSANDEERQQVIERMTTRGRDRDSRGR